MAESVGVRQYAEQRRGLAVAMDRATGSNADARTAGTVASRQVGLPPPLPPVHRRRHGR